MPTRENAMALAALAHPGQVDKAGAPYILHPLRVMLRVGTEAERMSAVLHDGVALTGCGQEEGRRRLLIGRVMAQGAAPTSE